MPMDQKAVRADFVIENSGSIEDTKHQVQEKNNNFHKQGNSHIKYKTIIQPSECKESVSIKDGHNELYSRCSVVI